jgi:hypothetical protein
VSQEKDSDASRLKYLKANMAIEVGDDTLNAMTELGSQLDL